MKKYILLLLVLISTSLQAQTDSLQFVIDILGRMQDRQNQIQVDEVESKPYEKKIISFFNVSTEADHLVNSYQIAQDSFIGLRAFVLLEKGLLNNGIISDGGKHPYQMNFSVIPNREGRGSWNGNFFQNFMRFKAMKNQVDFLIGVPECILCYDGTYCKFLYKNWQLWQYGSTPSEQWDKANEHFLAWLNSMTYIDENGKEKEIFDAVEVLNEPWGFTNEEYAIIEGARVEAWLEYNRQRGRYPKSLPGGGKDVSHMYPKLGTCAVPLGQGYTPEKGSMTMTGMVTKYAYAYTYVSGHVYNIDNNGWSDDFSITQNQLNTLEDFRSKFYPNAKLFITEIGSQVNSYWDDKQKKEIYVDAKKQAEYVAKVVAELEKNPHIMGVAWYSLRPIPNDRFGKVYYQRKGGEDTEGMDEIKKRTIWKTNKIRA